MGHRVKAGCITANYCDLNFLLAIKDFEILLAVIYKQVTHNHLSVIKLILEFCFCNRRRTRTFLLSNDVSIQGFQEVRILTHTL